MCPTADSIRASDPQPSPSGTSASLPKCVPKDPLSQAAYSHASKHLHPAILNHSLRTYLYAASIRDLEHSQSAIQPALLFTTCIFHDIGTADTYNGSFRFEVEGADAAVTFLQSQGVGAREAHDVWVAIALHTSPQIAEKISPLARLLRLAVLVDFRGHGRTTDLVVAEMATGNLVDGIEGMFPRLEIEKVLGDAVVRQAAERPMKAPASTWPGGMLRAHLEDPGWEGVNRAF